MEWLKCSNCSFKIHLLRIRNICNRFTFFANEILFRLRYKAPSLNLKYDDLDYQTDQHIHCITPVGLLKISFEESYQRTPCFGWNVTLYLSHCWSVCVCVGGCSLLFFLLSTWACTAVQKADEGSCFTCFWFDVNESKLKLQGVVGIRFHKVYL